MNISIRPCCDVSALCNENHNHHLADLRFVSIEFSVGPPARLLVRLPAEAESNKRISASYWRVSMEIAIAFVHFGISFLLSTHFEINSRTNTQIFYNFHFFHQQFHFFSLPLALSLSRQLYVLSCTHKIPYQFFDRLSPNNLFITCLMLLTYPRQIDC